MKDVRVLERWHESHDEHVVLYGDEARPEAVKHADAPPVVVTVDESRFYPTYIMNPYRFSFELTAEGPPSP